MRFDRRDFGRWLFSGLFAAVAIWALSAIAVSVFHARSDGWGTIVFQSAFGLLFSTPFALAAYFCFRRRYGDLFMIGAGIGSFLLLALGLAIPNRLGLFEAARHWKSDVPWRTPVMLAVSVVAIVGPFYLSERFLRACSRFAARRLPNGTVAGPLPSSGGL